MNFLIILLSVTMFASVGSAQWGSGGGGGADSSVKFKQNSRRQTVDPDTVTEETGRKRQKDILDDIHGWDDDAAGKPRKSPQTSQNPNSKKPPKIEEEYYDSWMPTLRPGFEVPSQYKQKLDARGPRGSDVDEEEAIAEQARANKPKRIPGKKEGDDKHLDKCLRQVSRFCSFNVMDEDFGAFSKCVYDVRYHVKPACFEWCENHGRCYADMMEFCGKLSPIQTTSCMVTKKDKLSADCLDSPYYKSLEEGIDDLNADGKNERQSSSPEGDDTPISKKSTPEELLETVKGEGLDVDNMGAEL